MVILVANCGLEFRAQRFESCFIILKCLIFEVFDVKLELVLDSSQNQSEGFFGSGTKQPILNGTKQPIFKIGQNSRFSKRDKIADW